MPSRVAAISMCASCARPWMVAVIASERSSIHFTGAPTLRETRSGDELLGVAVELGAEAAADVGSDHPHLGLGHVAADRQERAHEVGDLGGGVHRQVVAGRDPVGDHAAGLDRRRNQALVSEHLLDHHVGLGEGLVHAVGLVLDHDAGVVGVLLVHPRRAGRECVLDADHGLQRLVVDLHRVDRVAGGVAIGRHHHRHRLTQVPHAIGGKLRARGLAHLAGGIGRARNAGREAQVGGGDDGGHAVDRRAPPSRRSR